MIYHRVSIPTGAEFLTGWNHWIQGKVSEKFKRNKDRVPDTVQIVIVRLLAKDFIGRWLYKHLQDDLVDRDQAIKMLGGSSFIFSSAKSQILPVCGNRIRSIDPVFVAKDTSLWRIKDLLAYAKFDFDRYYYSPQNHTIDSDKMLYLLGYEPKQYGALQAMYRTKRLLPAEFTEHAGCLGLDKNCPECARGRASLYNKHLSLAHNWNDPSVARAVSKLRWNDKQVHGYLRWFRNMNMIKDIPSYIMRHDPRVSIESDVTFDLTPYDDLSKGLRTRISITAGLLKYANMLIDNEVINVFKKAARTDDMAISLFNNGASPELGNESVIGYDPSTEEDGHGDLTFLDPSAQSQFSVFENARDFDSIINSCQFSEEEMDILNKVELDEMSVKDYSNLTGVAVARIHRIRSSIGKQLRDKASSVKEDLDSLASEIANKYGINIREIFSNTKVGNCVRARTEFIANMSARGISPKQISHIYKFSESQVESALYRASVRPLPLNMTV